MVVLEQCRIDPEGKHLIVEASVRNLSYYDNVYIESVIIDTDKTYSPNGPSDSPVFKETFPVLSKQVEVIKDRIVAETDLEPGEIQPVRVNVKKIKFCLSDKDLDMSSLDNNIFFIYIVCTGTPDPHTPCGMDNEYVMGVAVNLRPIYNMAMGYVKQLDLACSVPRGFIDMILRLKAFDLSLKTGNFPMAFKYWNKLFRNKISVSPSKGCGCNGFN